MGVTNATVLREMSLFIHAWLVYCVGQGGWGFEIGKPAKAVLLEELIDSHFKASPDLRLINVYSGSSTNV